MSCYQFRLYIEIILVSPWWKHCRRTKLFTVGVMCLIFSKQIYKYLKSQIDESMI